MELFVDRDMHGARLERVDLSGARFERVDLRGAEMRSVDLGGADIRGAVLHGTRLRGVELSNVELSGELDGVIVNGVDIGPLVEAELDRRDPDRVKMRPRDASGFQEAWAIVGQRWDETIERARQLQSEALHERVDDEWSFIETLRHLNFASAAWVGRAILGDPAPWHPLDLPWDEAPDMEGVPRDRHARPSLDDVLAVRRDRRTMVSGVIDALTDDRLDESVGCMEPGWPLLEDVPLAQCLRVVINEEWEHRGFAERDLALLATTSA